MFDYLNEFLFWSRRGRRGDSYRRALFLKKQGDYVIFNRLCSEWVSRFKWTCDNPESAINAQLIERTILLGGACGFARYVRGEDEFKAEDWRNFRVTGMDNLGFYGDPVRCTLMDYVGRTVRQAIPALIEEPPGIADCALIYDNPDRFNPILMVLDYAEKLSSINASINGCIKNILGTAVISCSKEQAKEIVKQRAAAEVGVPYIVETGEFASIQDVKPELLSTNGASEELVTLMETQDKIHHDFLNDIGVRVNSEVDKKAGTTPMEIIENRQNVDLTLSRALEQRELGIELCEKIGLTGLSVRLDNFKPKTVSYMEDGGMLLAEQKEGGEEDDDDGTEM